MQYDILEAFLAFSSNRKFGDLRYEEISLAMLALSVSLSYFVYQGYAKYLD